MVTFGLGLLAPARGEDPPTGDLGLMQGKWKTEVGRDTRIPVTLEIAGDTVKVVFTNPQSGESVAMEGKVTIDEKATPRTIDWVGFKRPDGSDAPVNRGIYKIEDGKVTVCNGGPDNPRPTEFKAGEQGGPNLMVLERVKE
jgi:uncharacterized protein (TIGR03067 family)